MSKNKYGLSRTIPLSISRILRQETGFGCAICGSGIFQYEHIDPEFHEAKEHNPKCMTLLCPNCHNKVSTGKMSKETVWKAKYNPIALQKGFSNQWFDFSSDTIPSLQFGGTVTKNCSVPIMIHGVPVVKIDSPKEKNTPFLLSATFYNRHGEITLEIIDNEWKTFIGNWDFTYVGPVMKILSPEKKVCLQLRVNPPNVIIIEKLESVIDGIKVEVDKDSFTIGTDKFFGGFLTDSYIGLSI